MNRSEYMEQSAACYRRESGPLAAEDREAAFKVHRAYYGQFVTQTLQQAVIAHFGLDKLDEHFTPDNPHLNGVWPLEMWDYHLHDISARSLKEHGDILSLANAVCVAKEAARTAVEDYRARRSDR